MVPPASAMGRGLRSVAERSPVSWLIRRSGPPSGSAVKFAMRMLALVAVLAAGSCRIGLGVRSQRAIEKIDIHTHFFASRGYLVPLLERWHTRAVLVNFSDGQPDSIVRRRWGTLVAMRDSEPTRFLLCTTFGLEGIEQPDFGDRVVAQLRRDLDDGAVMVKVWKDLGMQIRDAHGAYVQVDDPRLPPIWDFLAKRAVPVLIHSADPRDGWRPLDPRSSHYQYFSTHPDYYPYLHPGIPSWGSIIASRDRWLSRNPQLLVIGAHLASMADDLEGLSKTLDAHPNLYVDVAARFGDMSRGPADRVRRFFLTYQDRILFGSDRSTNEGAQASSEASTDMKKTEMEYTAWWNYLTVTLRLPPAVLNKFYHGNAERLLGAAKAR